MPSLSAAIEYDNAHVHLDLDGFAETHRIEGREVVCSIDNEHLEKLKQGQNLGIAESDLLIFARTADLPRRKTPGSLVNFDGREYIVNYWSDNKGISQITMRQNRTV